LETTAGVIYFIINKLNIIKNKGLVLLVLIYRNTKEA